MIRELNTIRRLQNNALKVHFISLQKSSLAADRDMELETDSTLYSMDAGVARELLHVASVPVMMLVDEMGVLQDVIVGERPAAILATAVARAARSGRDG
jgi:hypothetical protein